MTKKTLIALATAWGPKHGGINSFNYDFVKALGVAFHDQVAVFCVVPSATDSEIEDARHSFVTLVRPDNPPQGEVLDVAYAAEIVRRLGNVADANTVWIGHDLFTGEAAVEAAAQTRSRVGSGIEKMEAVVASFAGMAPHQRRPLEPYHLIAAAYLTQHAPNPERAAAYGQAWRNFLDAHGNRMPATVTESPKRLNCAPPAGR